MTVIISLKYVSLVLRADNNGEGGLVAMLALASQSVKDKPRLRRVLLLVGIFGTCLFYGDGVITPAISVLSAVEGLEVVSPTFKKAVIPLTLLILFGLFFVQKRGTADIGKFFGPITLVWFAVIAVLGVSHILHNPEILWALSPHYALAFIWAEPLTTFLILGAVGAVCDWWRGLVCRHGAFWQEADSSGLVQHRDACFDLELFRPGCLVAQQPSCGQKPVLHDDPSLGSVATGGAGDAGYRDCLPGADHRRIFGEQAGDSAGLFAAFSGVAHQRQGTRANLYAVCQLGLVCVDCAGGCVVQVVEQSGGSLMALRSRWTC